MSFYSIAGIVCTIVSIILIAVYLIAHKIGDDSVASKIIMWLGMMFIFAGAAFMTIEYGFPDFAHPENKTVYNHFVKYYDNSYTSYINADEYIKVEHTQLNTVDGEEDIHCTLFLTDVLYKTDGTYYTIKIMNEYKYTTDFGYENVTSKDINNDR